MPGHGRPDAHESEDLPVAPAHRAPVVNGLVGSLRRSVVVVRRPADRTHAPSRDPITSLRGESR